MLYSSATLFVAAILPVVSLGLVYLLVKTIRSGMSIERFHPNPDSSQ